MSIWMKGIPECSANTTTGPAWLMVISLLYREKSACTSLDCAKSKLWDVSSSGELSFRGLVGVWLLGSVNFLHCRTKRKYWVHFETYRRAALARENKLCNSWYICSASSVAAVTGNRIISLSILTQPKVWFCGTCCQRWGTFARNSKDASSMLHSLPGPPEKHSSWGFIPNGRKNAAFLLNDWTRGQGSNLWVRLEAEITTNSCVADLSWRESVSAMISLITLQFPLCSLGISVSAEKHLFCWNSSLTEDRDTQELCPLFDQCTNDGAMMRLLLCNILKSKPEINAGRQSPSTCDLEGGLVLWRFCSEFLGWSLVLWDICARMLKPNTCGFWKRFSAESHCDFVTFSALRVAPLKWDLQSQVPMTNSWKAKESSHYLFRLEATAPLIFKLFYLPLHSVEVNLKKSKCTQKFNPIWKLSTVFICLFSDHCLQIERSTPDSHRVSWLFWPHMFTVNHPCLNWESDRRSALCAKLSSFMFLPLVKRPS